VTLDRSRLSRRQAPVAPESTSEEPVGDAVTVTLPLTTDAKEQKDAQGAPGTRVLRRIPDVQGQSLRAAARLLHRSGFRVRVEGWGAVTGTSPAAGAQAEPGSMIVVRAAVGRAS
jgi:hypothetical protein